MNSLKSHISLILALISILLSIFFYVTFSEILKKYQKSIVNNYSIAIVTDSPVESLKIKEIEKIEPININSYIQKLKKNFTNIDFDSIKFPYFYSLKLKTLPSPKRLEEIENYLSRQPFIKRVLTYRSAQTKIYNLLFLLKIVSNVFLIIVGILGFLLIIKQLEVWKFEHSERMYIMELFGAPFWFKGAALFKIAFVDSFISFLISAGIIYYFTNSALFNEIIKDLSINYNIGFTDILLKLFAVSLLISVLSSIIVIIGRKK
ncbi:FtsX-like permease family protein [Lebetimonas sp. JH292]|uniref:FtsX-like permease family protein n=1 Tax=Lebetimonas sp. JH292 TaxID=990068 RepID=UPI000467BE66|nr:FtsX-like permease family protein [Lebetimonas sp. JH292]